MKTVLLKKWLNKYSKLSLGVKAAFWYAVCNLLQKGISLIAVPIYTRILTTEQYGSYSVFLSWIDIFDIVVTLRIAGGSYIAGLTKYSNDRERYTSSVQGLEIFLTTIWLLIYLMFSKTINRFTGMSLSLTMIIFVLLYAMPTISFWMARQRVEYKYVPVVIITLLSSVFIPVLGIWAAMQIQTSKETGIIGARVFVQSAIALAIFINHLRKPSRFYCKEYWQKTLNFNIPLVPYYLSAIILQSSDRIMIKALVNTSTAGIYGVAYSAAMVMQLFNSSIHAALQPWLFQKLQTKKYKEISCTINLLVLFVAVLNLLLIAFAPEAIRILAPPAYQQAIWVVPPLAASVFVMFFYEHFINIEIFYEDSKMIATASIGAAVLNVILNFIFIPIFGFYVAGYTTLFSYLFFCFTHYLFMRRTCRKNHCPTNVIDIRTMLIIMLAFFALVFILAMGYSQLYLRYGVILVLLVTMFIKKEKVIAVFKTLNSKKDKSL